VHHRKSLLTQPWIQTNDPATVVTNHPSHDPDIQHLPFFAISPKFLNSLWSSYYKRIMVNDAFSRVFLSIQHKLFYVVMSLARFNLYANSYIFLVKSGLQGRRGWSWWLEIVGIAFYWTWYSAVLRGCGDWKTALGYLLISHIVPSPLHVQVLNLLVPALRPTHPFTDRFIPL
jgi:delta8-fatty-acid desaturase